MVVIKINPNVRAGLYARISLDRSGAKLGVKRQEKDCRALAASLGWEVAGTYVDNDLSASTGKTRPEYERLLSDLEAGQVNAVLAYHPDRLTRRPVELEHLIEVLDGVRAKVATVAGGDYDLSTASGRMVARIIGATARAEAERMGERVARKKLELAEAGKPPGGGMRPYGYEPGGMVLRPAEAAALQQAAADVLSGISYNQAAARLNEAGMVRDRGPWTGLALHQVLSGWRVAGVRTYRGEVVGPAAWPAILDPVTHGAIRDLTEMRRRAPARRVPYLIAGIGECGVCGARLYRRLEQNGEPAYYCAPRTGCGKVSVKQAKADAHIEAVISALLSDPANIPTIPDPEPDDRLEEVEARLTELASRHASGDLTDGEWAALRAPLREELSTLRKRSGFVSRVDAGTLVAVWEGADCGARNVVLRQLGVKVVLFPIGRGHRGPVGDRMRVVVQNDD